MTQLVKGIEHHYATAASARSSLATWIREGKVPGVRVEMGRPWRLYLAEPAQESAR